MDEANLGLATTRQLLDEIVVRAMICRLDDRFVGHGEVLHELEQFATTAIDRLPEQLLAYRTADA